MRTWFAPNFMLCSGYCVHVCIFNHISILKSIVVRLGADTDSTNAVAHNKM